MRTNKKNLITINILLFIILFSCFACKTNYGKIPLSQIAIKNNGIYKICLKEEYKEDIDKYLQYATEYRMDLIVNEHDSLMDGTINIKYWNNYNQPLNDICIKLLPNKYYVFSTISELKVNGKKSNFTTLEDNIHILIPLEEKLETGAHLSIDIKYRLKGTPRKHLLDAFPFYIEKEHFGLIYFYPVIAQYEKGKWDIIDISYAGDPINSEISKFIVRINYPADMTLIASGEQIGSHKIGDRSIDTFVMAPSREFSVYGGINYNLIAKQVGDVKIEAYYFRGEKRKAEKSIEIAEYSFPGMSDLFSTYPYNKFTLFPYVGSNYGFELPGMTALGSNMDPETRVDSITHEIAHQWFYGMVVGNQQREPWIDEAHAVYLVYLLFKFHGKEKESERYYKELREDWEYILTEYDHINLFKQVTAYEVREYYAVVYTGGFNFLYEIGKIIGFEKHQQLIREFVKTNKWKIVTKEDYLNFLNTNTSEDLIPIFRKWEDLSYNSP